MKSAAVICLAIIYGALSALAQTQDFNCSKSGAFSDCQLSDGSEIHCYDAGAGPSCQITHPNGFVAAAPSNGIMPLVLNAILTMHEKHVAKKAATNAESALEVNLKWIVLDADFFTAMKTFQPFLREPEKTRNIQFVANNQPIMERQLTDAAKYLIDILDMDERAPLAFAYDSKRLKSAHHAELVGACQLWEGTRKMRETFKRGDKPYPDALPQTIKAAFDDLQRDDESLDLTCTSKEAVKILKKAAKKQAAEAKPTNE